MFDKIIIEVDSMDFMTRRINQTLINDYCFRIEAAGVTVDRNSLIQRLGKMNEQEIISNMNTILSGREEEIISTLNGIGVNAVSSKINLEDEVAKKLNLESITEFENNGKSYFKFKDKEGNIRVTRNLGDDSKSLFMDILNNYNVVSNVDDKKNADEIFKFLNDYKLIGIGLENIKNLDNDKNISDVNREIINEMKKSYPDKEIMYSVTEDIYIIKGEGKEKDQILNLKSIDGKLTVNKIEQKGYKNDNEQQKQNSSVSEEEMNNSLENDEELSKMIIDNYQNNVSDDITISKIIEKLKEKYPDYKDEEKLMETAKNLVDKVKEKEGETIGHINSARRA